MDIWLQVDPDGKTRLYGRYHSRDTPRVQATFESMEMARKIFMFPDKVKVKLVL